MWSVISSVLSVLACFLSIAAVFYSARSVTVSRELLDQSSRLPASRISSLETSLADTQDALQAVANRVKMQRVRNIADHATGPRTKVGSSGEPDAATDPEGWRNWMNAQLRLGKKANA